MLFIHKCLQYSQFLTVALMLLAIAALPISPLWAQTDRATDEVPLSQPNLRNLKKGIYLYGQSSQPDQIGQEYILLEVTEGELMGVLYMPRSSFSCFQGEINNNQLEMMIDHPYEESLHEYAIALEETSPIASAKEKVAPLKLQGYVQVEEINANDRRMLATCREKF